MGKSEYKRDWHNYDENVITRYELMFPFYVFEHWWDLLAEENRHAKRTYEAPKESTNSWHSPTSSYLIGP
jgi:hypothetical protein